MASPRAFNGPAQMETFSTPIRPTSRRTPSLSSSPSFSSDSSLEESPLISPSTPLRSSGKPFSWEKLPGIPKKQAPGTKDHAVNLLPPPPARNPAPSKRFTRKNFTSDNFRKDPFFAAFVECSKEEDDGSFWKGSRVTRTLSDRFGLISMYTSCKSTSAVSESIIKEDEEASEAEEEESSFSPSLGLPLMAEF
ncbi:hypothetical protein RJ639_033763 [Escallonia herrerae]|uniref:Uncharacterized protein n=1 Tax=Escallonia herrerae TaxID=1293975 RepID=A0AA88WYN7_9ASTE|nr:hypothetical protein RJ639_033763 [Escallonia herrerae]